MLSNGKMKSNRRVRESIELELTAVLTSSPAQGLAQTVSEERKTGWNRNAEKDGRG